MIALQSDCLLFQLANGESVPCSAEMISFEITGNADGLLDPKCSTTPPRPCFTISRKELRRETVTVGEFAVALEKVLRNLGFVIRAGGIEGALAGGHRDRPRRLARESADSLELVFFPRLRDELRTQLRQSPRVAAFSRTARLRQAAHRRAPLEPSLRKIAGQDRRVFARLPHRRAGTKRMRAGGGINDFRRGERCEPQTFGSGRRGAPPSETKTYEQNIV
jgi:hypothetical protein